jgi:transposase
VEGLVAIVNLQFKLDPFSPTCAFIFCNKRRNAIKVLRYDKNGFVLATKKLLEGMKFQWPKDVCDVKNISSRQVEWLLQGLEIEQKKALPKIEMGGKNTCY